MRAHRPKYNVCDYCGRNPHKVAVRKPDGTVQGYCPSCYDRDAMVYAPGKDSGHNVVRYPVPFSAWAAGEGWTLVYDRRKRRPVGTEYLR